MDRYRKQGMEYRFHDDASGATATGGAEAPAAQPTGPGPGDESGRGAPAHDDGHPTHTCTDES